MASQLTALLSPVLQLASEGGAPAPTAIWKLPLAAVGFAVAAKPKAGYVFELFAAKARGSQAVATAGHRPILACEIFSVAPTQGGRW